MTNQDFNTNLQGIAWFAKKEKFNVKHSNANSINTWIVG